MSERLTENFLDEFELNERVTFKAPDGARLEGTIVRVYNARDDYHVETDEGHRYSINRNEDEIRRVRTL